MSLPAGGLGVSELRKDRYVAGMTVLAAFDDWWLASPRFRRFQAPPAAGGDPRPGRGIMRMGTRYAATLMHRATPVAAIREGYAVPDEPMRAEVHWHSEEGRHAHERSLVEAASRFRAYLGQSGPVATETLLAAFLHMLLLRAGELAYHHEFTFGARRPSETVEDPVGDSGTWIFGNGPADGVETVVPSAGAIAQSSHRLTGWADGRLYLTTPTGAERVIEEGSALHREIIALCVARLPELERSGREPA